MAAEVWEKAERPPEELTWLLSGFTSGPVNNVIRHEFPGPSSGTRSFQYREVCLIGRDPDKCAFIIPDSEQTVSRVHAELRFVFGKGLCIRDLNSRNGTFLNDRQLDGTEPQFLKLSDEIRLGNLTLRVSYPR